VEKCWHILFVTAHLRVNIATNIMAEHICQTIPQDFGAAGRSEIARARAVVRDLADRAAESLAFAGFFRAELFGAAQ